MNLQSEQSNNDKIFEYLQKSYAIIERLNETNKIIILKNKELFTKNIILLTKIKKLEEENKLIKQNYKNTEKNNEDFELV